MIIKKPVDSVRNMVNIPNNHPKIMDIIIDMISTSSMPYYGEFCQFLTFKEATDINTCAVSVTENGMVFYWNKEFVDSLTDKGMYFVIIHEIFHLLFDHPKRSVGYDPKMSNLAQDMIINSIIQQDIISVSRYEKIVEIPQDIHDNNMGVFIPDDYTGSWIFEELYFYLVKNYEEWKDANKDKTAESLLQQKIDQLNEQYGEDYDPDGEQGDGDGDGDGDDGDDGDDTQEGGSGMSREEYNNQKDSNGNPIYGKYGKHGVEMYSIEHMFENVEQNKGITLDQHIIDEVTPEARENIVNHAKQTLKNKGLEKGDIVETLNKLRKKKKDYLKFIKRQLTNQIFGKKKQKTIFRPNRRGIWGLKGKRKYSTAINVLLDVSGSMSGEFEKVLSYVFQNDLEMNLIQVDVGIQKVQTISSMKELENVEIKGLGGTEITPGIQYIANDNQLNALNTVILTDGYTDRLDFSGIKGKTLIISTHVECSIDNNKNIVKQILIEKE